MNWLGSIINNLNQNKYHLGGMGMPLRKYHSASQYRYGFNGKEKDNAPIQYDYGFRIYDPRLVRFKSVDPLFKSYPWNSPYSFAENDVVRSTDLDGKEKSIVIYDFSTNKIKKTKIDLPTAGSLGNGVLIQSNQGGKTAYYYGNEIPNANITSFKMVYEGVVLDKLGNHIGYNDSKGYPTIGYGHLIKKGEKYTIGGSITENEAQTLFNSDSKSIFSKSDEYLKSFSLAENKKNALYDASFNMGAGKMIQYDEDGGKYSGENFFLKFMGGGEGLKKRRYAENILFSDGMYLKLDVIKRSTTKAIAEKIVKFSTSNTPSTEDKSKKAGQ